jgi:mono/diheme cytochrome c family protein
METRLRAEPGPCHGRNGRAGFGSHGRKEELDGPGIDSSPDEGLVSNDSRIKDGGKKGRRGGTERQGADVGASLSGLVQTAVDPVKHGTLS